MTIISQRLTEVDGTVIDLDLSQLRAHVKAMHPHEMRLPRSNAGLAVFHARLHSRFRPSHFHEGGRRMVRASGLKVEYELNDYTGKNPVTREEADARFRARIKEDGLSASPVIFYSIGVISMSVCTKVDDTETVRIANQLQPTGISSPWRLSEDKTFATGQANGAACETTPGRRHLLLNC